MKYLVEEPLVTLAIIKVPVTPSKPVTLAEAEAAFKSKADFNLASESVWSQVIVGGFLMKVVPLLEVQDLAITELVELSLISLLVTLEASAFEIFSPVIKS